MSRQSAPDPRPREKSPNGSPDVFTIGHSTHEIALFVEMLTAHRIARVVDVRTVPRSRHNPQYNTDALQGSLATAGIDYTHCPELGGLRHPHKDSPNTGWRNLWFRGFADYMQTPAFTAAVDTLIGVIRTECVALLCAEAVPWRCHRSLIADALTLRGLRVSHIMGAATTRPHVTTAWAHVEGERITYPPPS